MSDERTRDGIGKSLRRLGGRIRDRLLVPFTVRRSLRDILRRLDNLERRIRSLQEGVGRLEGRQIDDLDPDDLESREFRVYSQWGEDGIIRFLSDRIDPASTTFVEFGVETYEEANTRFLMIDRNWSGLVIDASSWAIDRIRSSRDYWLHDLTAVQAFVTRDNIDRILREHGFEGEIGLLSIDIDGMDFWIWDAIDAIQPAIVVVEYNHRFGPDTSVTVPYDPDFDRWKAHHSILYYGASLQALERLGRNKGYDLVGCGSAGLNAFFVRGDLRPPDLPARRASEAWIEGRFREAHDARGERIALSREEERELVLGMPLTEVDSDGRPLSGAVGTSDETQP